MPLTVGLFVPTEDYPQIRAAIDLTLDETNIPDTMIEYDIYLARAEEEVTSQDPLWATHMLDATNNLHMKRAAIFYCARLLIMAVPMMEMEYFGEYRYHRDVTDWKTIAGNLGALGDSELAYVLDSGALTMNLPTMFTAAAGRRVRPTVNIGPFPGTPAWEGI